MVALLTIVIIVATVWAVVFVRHAGLAGVCLATILTGVCFGHAFFHFSVGPAPLTADRLLAVAAVVLYGLYRLNGAADPKPIGSADLLFTAFLAYLTCNTLAHNFRLDNYAPAAKLLFLFIVPAALYWIGRQTRLTPATVRLILAVWGGFALYLAVTGFAEIRQWWFLVFPKYIGSAAHSEFFGRARGPFLNPVGCGLYLSAGLFALAMGWPRVRGAAKCWPLLGLTIVLIGVCCTLTRSVWIGAAGGLWLIVFLAVRRKFRPALVVATLFVAGLTAVAKHDGLASFKRDKEVSVYHMQQSAKLRPILAAIAWRMFQDRPVCGFGYGQYLEHNRDYLRDSLGDLPLSMAKNYVQHNVFLALLVETGATGFVLWLAVLVAWGRSAWRLWQDASRELVERQMGLVLLALLFAYTVNGLFHDVSVIVMVNHLLFFLAGVTQGLAASRPPSPPEPTPAVVELANRSEPVASLAAVPLQLNP